MIAALLLGLLACPAEQLGVDLPARGVEALSQSDLQRDTRILARATGGERLEALHRRLGEMHLEPAFPGGWRAEGLGSCGLRPGRREAPAVLVAALDDARSVTGGAAPAAALISLAKVTDLGGPLDRPWLYCDLVPGGLEVLLADPPLPIGRGVVLGPLGDGPFELGAGPIRSVISPGADPDLRAGGLDYRVFRDRVAAIHALSRQP